MDLKDYKLLADVFGLTNDELKIFIYNYYDSFAYNEYLSNNINYIDFNAESIIQLDKFFDDNGVDEYTKKRIIVSMPMILSCSDFEKQLSIIYKDSVLEGIIIRDSKDVLHPYRIKKIPRSITENISLINNLITSNKEDYKKSYYIRSWDEKTR